MIELVKSRILICRIFISSVTHTKQESEWGLYKTFFLISFAVLLLLLQSCGNHIKWLISKLCDLCKWQFHTALSDWLTFPTPTYFTPLFSLHPLFTSFSIHLSLNPHIKLLDKWMTQDNHIVNFLLNYLCFSIFFESEGLISTEGD